MTAPRPTPLQHSLLAIGRHQGERAKATTRRLLATAVQESFWVLLLCGLLGYAFLGGQLIYFRRSVLAFNPNVKIGIAKFKLLAANFLDWPGGPSCISREPETLLIQTTATRFEDIIAYSRRIASPNDHDLMAVFVRDTVAGQPWKKLAEQGFRRLGHHDVIIPPNWLAKLYVQQGRMYGGVAVRSSLIDLQGYGTKRELRIWRAEANYDTDSLREYQLIYCDACVPFTVQKNSLGKRRLALTDAAYYSPRRLGMRKWQSQNH